MGHPTSDDDPGSFIPSNLTEEARQRRRPSTSLPVRSRCRCHCHDDFADIVHIAACCVPDPDWPAE